MATQLFFEKFSENFNIGLNSVLLSKDIIIKPTGSKVVSAPGPPVSPISSSSSSLELCCAYCKIQFFISGFSLFAAAVEVFKIKIYKTKNEDG